ncbi:MAG: hypothetical protein ABI120_10120 [Gemmatimonadaceae bacterium]
MPPAAGDGRHGAQPDYRDADGGNESTNRQRGETRTAGLQHVQRRLAQRSRGDVAERGRHLILEALETNLRQQNSNVGAGNRPDGRGREETSTSRRAHTSSNPGRTALRDKSGNRMEGGRMPRFEHLDLTHDLVGKRERRRKVWQAIKQEDNFARPIKIHLALNARTDVSPDRRHAETFFAIEKEIDLVCS